MKTSRWADKRLVSFGFVMIVLGIALLRFAWSDVMSGFEDDSVSYLILAQWMSPWFQSSEIITEAAQFEKYPPLFPVLLAITGASHQLLVAHLLIVACHLVAILLMFLFATRLLHAFWAPVLASTIFAISPSLWLNILGILSEGLYLVISLALFLYLESHDELKGRNRTRRWLVITGLLTALIMTRSIGVAAVAAFAVSQWVLEKSFWKLFQLKILVPIFVPLVAALAWSLVLGTPGEGGYVTAFMVNIGSFEWMTQLSGLYQFWIRALVLYWSDANMAQYLAAIVFGLLAVAGTIRRVLDNRLDGWYVVFYLLILLVWPYFAQMGRFLHGLLPVLIVHGFVGAEWFLRALRQTTQTKVVTAIGLVMLGLMLPTMAFFAGRAGYQTPINGMDFSRVSVFYMEIDQGAAEFRALRNEMLRLDLQRIRETTPKDAVIMWFTPSYVRLVSDRQSVAMPTLEDGPDFRARVIESGATHVLISSLHPRKTREIVDVGQVSRHFEGFTQVIWEVTFPGADTASSVLLQVIPPAH